MPVPTFARPKICEEQKLFACDGCEKQYARAASLIRHKQSKHTLLFATRRSHSGMKEFACEICNKQFSSKLYLNVHRRSMHDVQNIMTFKNLFNVFCYNRIFSN